ncbi:hypothetical protein LX32DRAFT_654998 [Colletotrichum zoysiae]|uniref:Uncharacterized protein n=1 Tax=Colletotrichum zoysiae TaxID=1216348 RepID=A0AAD9M1K9_9PEZI|nr:hypothetical protein LX32DRAFT_654998 [Colletotrichum zoysiae]
MAFLPATFVAWIPDGSEKMVSSFLWIYFSVALILTLFTVWLLRRLANPKRTKESGVEDPEKALIPRALQSLKWNIEIARLSSNFYPCNRRLRMGQKRFQT